MRTVASLVVRPTSVEVTPNRLIDVTSRLNTARTICIKIQALLHSYVKVTRSLSGGVSVRGSLFLGGVLSRGGSLSKRGSLSMGHVSVQGSLSGGFYLGVSVKRALCPEGVSVQGGSPSRVSSLSRWGRCREASPPESKKPVLTGMLSCLLVLLEKFKSLSFIMLYFGFVTDFRFFNCNKNYNK